MMVPCPALLCSQHDHSLLLLSLNRAATRGRIVRSPDFDSATVNNSQKAASP